MADRASTSSIGRWLGRYIVWLGLGIVLLACWLLFIDLWLAPPSSMEPPPVNPGTSDLNAKWRVIVPTTLVLLALVGAMLIGMGLTRKQLGEQSAP